MTTNLDSGVSNSSSAEESTGEAGSSQATHGSHASSRGRWRDWGRRQVLVFLLVWGSAQVVIVLFSFSAFSGAEKWTALGQLSLIGAAGVAVGIFFGFLFGVPRTSVSSGDAGSPAVTVASVSVTTDNETAPNTNLETISDWLTKILVGATLTQLGNIPSAAVTLFGAISLGLGGTASVQTFVGALLIYASLFGFMLGWFTARAWIGPVIKAVGESVPHA